MDRASVLVVALALLALATGHAVKAESAPHTFEWAAPPTHTGPLAVRLTFDFGAANACVFKRVTSGPDGKPPVRMWEESNDAHGSLYSTWTAHAEATVAGSRVDTRERLSSGGRWSLESTTTGPFNGNLTFTLVVADGGSWENAVGYRAPLSIKVTCDAPFTVGGFHRGYEAFGFTADSLRGDTTANANQIVGSVNLVENGRIDGAFDSTLVTFRGSVRSTNSLVEGALTLTSPAGTTTWALDGDDRLDLVGGAGAYDFEVDYRSVGAYDRLIGMVYGLDPVAAL